ncbi:MAG: hypothetical protein AAF721_04640 [Myxococcota bacterium]
MVTKKSKAGRHAERNDDRIRPIGPDTPVLSARKPDRGLRKVGKRPYAARAPSTKLHYQSRDVRLLATLTQNDPQDESTDEIFYKLIAVKADHNVVSHHVASKGEWSMGKKANHFMLHNLFEGTVGRRQDIAFVLVVADNDIGGDWLSGNTIPAEERAADWGLARIRANVPADQRAAVRDQFAANIRQAVHDVLWETGDLIGFTAFAFQGGKLKVIAPTGSWSEVSTANATGASFTLRGLGANYTVRLDVKDAAQPTPRQFNYLSTEDEECDQHTVLMKSETGDVAINRGQVKDVDVIYRNMFWRCGAEQENTKGPANTHYAVVRRKPTGEDMYIFTYSYFPAFAAIDLL